MTTGTGTLDNVLIMSFDTSAAEASIALAKEWYSKSADFLPTYTTVSKAGVSTTQTMSSTYPVIAAAGGSPAPNPNTGGSPAVAYALYVAGHSQYVNSAYTTYLIKLVPPAPPRACRQRNPCPS